MKKEKIERKTDYNKRIERKETGDLRGIKLYGRFQRDEKFVK